MQASAQTAILGHDNSVLTVKPKTSAKSFTAVISGIIAQKTHIIESFTYKDVNNTKGKYMGLYAVEALRTCP